MADVVDKLPTGRTVKTYYNTGTYETPDWVEIGWIDGEKYKPGEKSYFSQPIRESRLELQGEGAQSPAEFELDYFARVGVTDDVWDDLNDACAPGAAALDIALADDDITLVGTSYDRGFFSVTETDHDRPLDGFTKHTLKFTEVDHYESGVLVQLTTTTVVGA